MNSLIQKHKRLDRRKARIRAKISGTTERPRISVFKSNKHLYVQVIDDAKGHTLASISNIGEYKNLKVTVADAEKLGQALGEKLKTLKITQAVYDRNGMLYHGVIKALAEGIRKSEIKF